MAVCPHVRVCPCVHTSMCVHECVCGWCACVSPVYTALCMSLGTGWHGLAPGAPEFADKYAKPCVALSPHKTEEQKSVRKERIRLPGEEAVTRSINV